MASDGVTETPLVQVLALKLDPEWRLPPQGQRATDFEEFRRAVERTARDVATTTYTMVGLRADADLLLFRVAATLESLEETASLLLRSGVGRAMRVAHSFLGIVRPSRYVRKPTIQEQAILSGERGTYLIVYPFTKTAEWYRLSPETRQGMMNEHMRIGHDYPQVRQLLAHSTGLDDQEFIVAYETDDLVGFQDLVIKLRETEGRRFTLRDQPILTAIRRPLEDALRLLG